MKFANFRIFYPESMNADKFVGDLNSPLTTRFSLKTGAVVALSAPMFNLEHRDAYTLELHSKSKDLPEPPKNIIRQLFPDGLEIIDEVLIIGELCNPCILEVIPTVGTEDLAKISRSLSPYYAGFVRKSSYPICREFERRQDGFTVSLNGPVDYKKAVEDHLSKRFADRFALSVESQDFRLLASFR